MIKEAHFPSIFFGAAGSSSPLHSDGAPPALPPFFPLSRECAIVMINETDFPSIFFGAQGSSSPLHSDGAQPALPSELS